MYCSKWNRDCSERSQGKTWRCGDQLFRFLDHNFGEYWRSIFKAVYSRLMFWHYRYSKCHISGNNVNVDCIVVSLFCPGCALFEYVIKREYVSTDKWLNLTCAVTYCDGEAWLIGFIFKWFVNFLVYRNYVCYIIKLILLRPHVYVFFFFHFILIPLICGADVRWHPCSMIVHFISRQSLLKSTTIGCCYRAENGKDYSLSNIYVIQSTRWQTRTVYYWGILTFPKSTGALNSQVTSCLFIDTLMIQPSDSRSDQCSTTTITAQYVFRVSLISESTRIDAESPRVVAESPPRIADRPRRRTTTHARPCTTKCSGVVGSGTGGATLWTTDHWARADLTATNGRNVLFAVLLRSIRCFQIIIMFSIFWAATLHCSRDLIFVLSIFLSCDKIMMYK